MQKSRLSTVIGNRNLLLLDVPLESKKRMARK